MQPQYGLTGADVSDEVFESAASIVFEPAENRLPTIKAVLVRGLGRPCGGGGGVPYGAGRLTGVEAVVDKDLTAAALAVTMAADRMLLRACGRFPSSTGHPSSIAALTDAAAVLSGAAGTTITPDRAAGSRAPVGAGAACRP